MSKENILFPAGRMVWGSVDQQRTTDFNGNPLTVKSGPNAGQPTQRTELGVAIPKGAESAWWETEWGQKLFAVAQAGFPGGETQRQDFSWKVVDGDSTVLNQNNVRWCDKEGYPGHWVVSFGTSLPVTRHALDPATGKPFDITQDGEIVPGYFVEVYGDVEGNKNPQKPGIFVNPKMVCRVGYGERIISGPNAQAVGFGSAGMPAGASQAPVGNAMAPGPQGVQPAMQPQPTAQPAMQPQPTAQPAMQPQPTAQPAMQPQPAVGVQPNAGFLQPQVQQ